MKEDSFVYREKTIHLQDRFVTGVQTWERSANSSFLDDPWMWTQKLRNRSRNLRNTLRIGELAVRYEGILNQLLYRCKGDVPDETRTEYYDRIWLLLSARALTMSGPEEFAPVLWATAQKEAGGSGALSDKFFLRQFLDEMPVGEERSALHLLAFQKNAGAEGVGVGWLRVLDRAYLVLHNTLLDQGARLENYTGGAWTHTMLSSQLIDYEQILFG